MIRHIVFFTARDQKYKETIYNGLLTLTNIPDCLQIEVGINTRHDPISQKSPDFIVYAEFDSDEQLARFKNHELYEKSIQIVRPLRDMRIAADFDAAF